MIRDNIEEGLGSRILEMMEREYYCVQWIAGLTKKSISIVTY